MKFTPFGKIGLLVAMHSFLERFTFLYITIAPITRSYGLSYGFISACLAVQEIAKLLTEIPTGGFSDIIAPLPIIKVGVVIKGIGLLLIASIHSPMATLIGMGLIGIGRAFCFSKIEPYAYQFLKENNIKTEEQFPKVLFLRNAAANLAATLVGGIFSLSNKITILSVTNMLFFSALLSLFCHLQLLHFFPKVLAIKSTIWHKSSPLKNLKELIPVIKSSLKNYQLAIFMILSIAFSVAFIFVSDANKVVFFEMKLAREQIGRIYIFVHILSFLLDMFFAKFYKSMFFKGIALIGATILLCAGCAILLKPQIWIILSIMYLTLNPLFLSVVNSNLAQQTADFGRFSLTSIVGAGTSLINVIFFMTMFWAGKILPSNIAIFGIAFTISLTVFISVYIFTITSKQTR